MLYEQSAEFDFCSLLVLQNFDRNAYFLNEEKKIENFSLAQTVVKVGTLLIMILKNNDYKSCNQFAEVIAQCFLVNLICTIRFDIHFFQLWILSEVQVLLEDLIASMYVILFCKKSPRLDFSAEMIISILFDTKACNG